MPILQVEALRKAYGSLNAVDGISFAVQPGECFGLLGPNGAGKTTTIRMLYGYTPRDAGRLELFGLDIDQHLREIKRRIGICQQEDSLDPDLSVRDNLIGYARYFSIPRQAAQQSADELLEFFALQGRAKNKIMTLSGGLKRRLMLARALVNQPELLILDEPTTGLDPQSRQLLWQKLAELKGRGLTILLTTHYMEEAERLCDRLVIVDHGRILVDGQPRALVREHVGHTVLEIADPDAAVRDFLSGQSCRMEDLDRRLLVYLDDGDELFLKLTREVRAEGCTLRPASLEDLFLKLTGRELRE
ncbi:MAG: ATP-binding cassette domain-containing protein [Desulfuromonadales bacterium]|jgi:lipooligosaccharide transport system ATP-binding protein